PPPDTPRRPMRTKCRRNAMPTADPKQAARATESAAAAGSADVSAASAPARTGGLLARLGRWLDRDHLPDPEALRALYEASLTDGGANHLARQWAERYRAADADERRSLLDKKFLCHGFAGVTRGEKRRLYTLDPGKIGRAHV